MTEGKKDNTVWIVVAVLAAVVLLGPVLMGGVMGTSWSWFSGWWLLMPLMMLVPVALVALLVYLVVRAATPHAPQGDDARRVLDLRLARGEITEEEHDRLLDRIR